MQMQLAEMFIYPTPVYLQYKNLDARRLQHLNA